MQAAVGLLVEPDDVDDADRVDALGDEADLGADEILVPERLVPCDPRHLDRSRRSQLDVDQLLDQWTEPLGQGVELEVHPGRQRLHVPARDRHAPPVPDHATQDVEGGMGAHEGVATLPVDLPRYVLALGRHRIARHRVPDLVALHPDLGDLCIRQPPGVVGLAAAGRVEGGAVEAHVVPPHLGHAGLEGPQVGVTQAQQLRHQPEATSPPR